MPETFIPNSERDSKIPPDVIEIIDKARNTSGLNLERKYEIDDLMLSGAKNLQNKYGKLVKYSYAWHKLSSSSVENPGEVIDPDIIRIIDDEVADFVRNTLLPFLSK